MLFVMSQRVFLELPLLPVKPARVYLFLIPSPFHACLVIASNEVTQTVLFLGGCKQRAEYDVFLPTFIEEFFFF